MKYICILLSLVFSGVSHADETKVNILTLSSKPSVTTYRYKGKLYKFIDNRNQCCDHGAILYDEDNNMVCYIIGSIDSWYKECEELALKIIYQESKIPNDMVEQDSPAN